MNIGYLFSSLAEHSQLEVFANFFTYDEIQDAIDVSRNNMADIIGIPLLQANYYPAMQFISRIKDFLPNVHITVGNVFATTYPEYCMKSAINIDTVVCGEGEHSLFTLCDAIVKGEDISKCKGIYYREKDNVICSNEMRRIDNLDLLAYPWRDSTNSRSNEYGIIGSRGCTGKCSFCVNNAMWGGKLRVISVDNILNEAQMLVEKYGCKHITFYDSTFFCNNNAVNSRLTELYYGIKNVKLMFRFQ